MSDTARIWKFEISQPNDRNRSFVEDVPEGAELLSVGLQGDAMVLWALVREQADSGPRRLIVANTGTDVEMPDGACFLGAVTTDNGIVWHIFDGDAETTA